MATTAVLLAAAAKKKSSGSSAFLIIIVIFLGVYLLFLRPQRKKQRAALAARKAAEVGDEVLTAAGIFGRVVAMADDRATVEIAPGTTIEVALRALGQRIDPVEETDGEEGDDLDGGSGFGHPGYDGHDDLEGGTGFGHPGYDGHDDLENGEHVDHESEHDGPAGPS